MREHLTIHSLVQEQDRIRVDCASRFIARVDAPDFVVTPLKAGEWIETRVRVDCALRDGLIRQIQVVRTSCPEP